MCPLCCAACVDTSMNYYRCSHLSKPQPFIKKKQANKKKKLERPHAWEHSFLTSGRVPDREQVDSRMSFVINVLILLPLLYKRVVTHPGNSKISDISSSFLDCAGRQKNPGGCLHSLTGEVESSDVSGQSTNADRESRQESLGFLFVFFFAR